MHIALIGCGLIGTKRARALTQRPNDPTIQRSNDHLLIVADVDSARAEQLAREYGCQATTDWEQVVNHPQVEAVVVSTANKFLMPIAVAALKRGKHVLVEKPMARNLAEAEQVLCVTGRRGDRENVPPLPCSSAPLLPVPPAPPLPRLAVGFNHRYHPAIWKAHELCASGAIGPLMFIRCVYGHGGRPGYDKEWRADPDLAGGGELLDQGVHIVDLCRWFLGEFSEVVGFIGTYFWDLGYFETTDNRQQTTDNRQQATIRHSPFAIRHQLEDNAFALLRTADGKVAQFHTSWTQWKNRFTFEVFGREGYVIVEGLGGSYGVETLIVGHRRVESGPPLEEKFEFPGPDLSWQAEWQEFTAAIREQREPLANGEDGWQAMRLIDAIYESARTGKTVRLKNH